MPYIKPTLTQFRTRFPVFDDADDALILMLIDEAEGQVSTEWTERDYQPAILYLAAHLLATDPSLSGEAGVVSTGPTGSENIKSESLGGGLSVSYGRDAGAGTDLSSSERYGATEYGRRYLALLRDNFPAIMVV